MGVSLAYRVTYHDNVVATIREGDWRDLPFSGVQRVELLDVTAGKRRLIARLDGFDFYFADAGRLGGWSEKPGRFAAPGGTPILDPYTALELALFRRLGIDASTLEKVPGGQPGQLWRISRRGAVTYAGPMALFPDNGRPPEASSAPTKGGSLIDDDRAKELGLAVRWREWLAREGRT
jgi:hypothetical protein